MKFSTLTQRTFLFVFLLGLIYNCPAVTPTCTSQPAGLVSWWRAEGNALDSISGANGSPTGGVSFAAGKVGTAFSFNGVDGGINIPDLPVLALTHSLTIEGWLFVTNAPSVTGMVLFRGDTRPALDPYFLSVEAGGILRFAVENDNTAYIDSIMPTGGWTHVAATLDDATGLMTLYTNGVVAAQTTTTVRPLATLDPAFAAGVGIGNHSHVPGQFNYPFRGLIDELSLYNRALSSNEVQAIYNAGIYGKCSTGDKPTILIQPTNETVNAGISAQFTVSASGTAPLTYQWFNGASPINGATASSYTIPNPQIIDQATYSVIVSNDFGFAVSSNATLTVLSVQTNCVTPPSGLVAWWRAEGNAQDSIDGGSGTPYGGVSFAPGQVGSAFSFDGVNGAINVPDVPSLALTHGLTIEGWIFVTNTVTGTEMILFRGDTRPGLDPYFLDVEAQSGTPGHIRFAVTDQNNNITYIDAPLTIGAWTHVAGTLDDSTGVMRIYTNGAVAVQTTTSVRPLGALDPNSAPGIGIGNHSHIPGQFNYPFKGLIDELSLYNRGLSSSEVAAIYSAGAAGKCPVASGPTILSQPMDQTVDAGATASFAVQAEGTPPLMYQWFKGTESIAGATSNVLTIVNAQTNNAGTYSVVVSNASGSIPSSNAVLTVLLPETNCSPAPAGLVAWWRAEADANDSVDGANGVLYGSVGFAPGRVGTAFAFNGIDGGVNVPDVPSLALTNGLTIEGWIFVTNAVTGTEMILFRGDTRSGLDPYFLDVEAQSGTPGHIRFAVTDQNNDLTYIDAPLPIGAWTHVAGTLDDATGVMRIYTNGAVAVQTTTSVRPLGALDPNSAPGIGIGNHSRIPGQFNYPFKGLIDELSVYNRGLSSTEVQGIYRAGAAGKCPVITGPTILSQPMSQTVNLGATVSFAVQAEGTPPLTYQWFKGTESITGATSNVYTIMGAEPSNAGSYSVVVSNASGSMPSSNAVLTVLLAETNCFFVPEGLVAWWRAEGNANDSIDGGNGVPFGGVSFAPGRVGSAFAFDGTDGGINVPDVPALAVTNGLTIEGWIFVTNTVTGTGMILFRGDTRSGLDPYFLDVEAQPGTSGHIRFAVTDQSNNITYIDAPLPTGAWTHVAGTLDDATGIMRIYTNGITAVETTTTVRPLRQLDPAFGAGVGIGNHSHIPGQFNYPFKGLIDELSLYNRGLSSDEIQSIYHAGEAGKCFGMPVPIIKVSPLSHFAGVTNLVIISPNNINALATFDGRMSYDLEHTNFTFAWLESGSVFSTNSVATRVLAVGTHVITLRLDDTFPGGVSSASVSVEVVTAAEAVGILFGLIDDSNLPQQTKMALEAKLKVAVAAFDRGDFNAGGNVLAAFQNSVSAQVQPFNSVLGNQLSEGASTIIDATRPTTKGRGAAAVER